MRKQPERVGEAKNAKAGLRAANMQNSISRRIGILVWLCDHPNRDQIEDLGWPYF